MLVFYDVFFKQVVVEQGGTRHMHELEDAKILRAQLDSAIRSADSAKNMAEREAKQAVQVNG